MNVNIYSLRFERHAYLLVNCTTICNNWNWNKKSKIK